MRVALGVFVGALLFLAASIAGIDPVAGDRADRSVVVVLGRPAASAPPTAPPAPSTTTSTAVSRRPLTVETVKPDIEHYDDIDDYYRDDGDSGAADSDDGYSGDDPEVVDDDIDVDIDDRSVDDEGVEGEETDDEKDNSGRGVSRGRGHKDDDD